MRTLLLALLLMPTPDVIPPGHKGVTHELVLRWDERAAGHRFVAFPTRGFGGAHEIEQGAPFSFSSKYGTQIWAVPAGSAFPDRGDAVAELEWPRAPVPVAEVSSVAAGNPLSRIESLAVVVDVTGDSIEFELLGDRRFDAAGRQIGESDQFSLLWIAGGGIALLVVLGFWRSRRATAPTAA